MYAPHEDAHDLRCRAHSVVCPAVLTVPQGGMTAPPAVFPAGASAFWGPSAAARCLLLRLGPPSPWIPAPVHAGNDDNEFAVDAIEDSVGKAKHQRAPGFSKHHRVPGGMRCN